MKYVFVQIGAGAGDRDARAEFRDGFTEVVKKIDRKLIDRIILVEPNPLNIPMLKECWKSYPQAEIFQLGIVPSDFKNQSITFYYCEEDKPNYQVFSMSRDHVVKHYPQAEILQLEVPVMSLSDFLAKNLRPKEIINLLSLDIEGIDAEILLDVDWKNINCQKLSFEYIHLGEKAEPVLRRLGSSGYIFIGSGVDYNGFDFMYEKIDLTGHPEKLDLDLSFKKHILIKKVPIGKFFFERFRSLAVAVRSKIKMH